MRDCRSHTHLFHVLINWHNFMCERGWVVLPNANLYALSCTGKHNRKSFCVTSSYVRKDTQKTHTQSTQSFMTTTKIIYTGKDPKSQLWWHTLNNMNMYSLPIHPKHYTNNQKLPAWSIRWFHNPIDWVNISTAFSANRQMFNCHCNILYKYRVTEVQYWCMWQVLCELWCC